MHCRSTYLLLAVCAAFAACPAKADIRSLPVPTATIPAYGTITSGMMTDRQFRVTATSVTGFATSRGQLVGMQARRRLVAGKPVPLSAVSPPTAAKRGASVPAVYVDGGISISTTLIALQDGAAGDVVTARNPGTGAVVRASVNSDGSLTVGWQ